MYQSRRTREEEAADRIKKAAGNGQFKFSLDDESSEYARKKPREFLKAAIETQKEVIEDQNERLELTIANLREFGYDADVRIGKDGRVEMNAD